MVGEEALGGRGGRRTPTRHSTARCPPWAPPPPRPVAQYGALSAMGAAAAAAGCA